MIGEYIIQAWKNNHAPWQTPIMVEQDLIISRILINLYNEAEIRKTLAFRGGTALNKIYIQPAARYSEDLDFVQINAAPIGNVVNAIRNALDPWLGEPKRKMTERSVKLIYSYKSSENFPGKLKIEINTTEHFHYLNLLEKDFAMSSDWFQGQAKITTYQLDELMGTKLRALYQRRKGRDLFDLWYVLHHNLIDIATVIAVFNEHCDRSQQIVTRALFEKSLNEKKEDLGFRTEMNYLIHPEINYNFDNAYELVLKSIIKKLPGDAWKSIKTYRKTSAIFE